MHHQARQFYVEILRWPKDPSHLSEVKSKVAKAYLLADPARQALEVTQAGAEVSISLPDKAPDAIALVLCLETEDDPPVAAAR